MLAILALPLLAGLASAHGIFMKVEGANGKSVTGLGAAGVTTTGHSGFYNAPRFGSGKTCGVNRRKETSTYYEIDWQSALKAQVKSGLPTTSGNTVTAEYWQVNEDGAGPFSCQVSTNAKGTSWKSMKVTTNVPGSSRGKSDLFQRYHTLKAELPSGTKCTGTGGACLIRCKNPNDNAFGGCFAVKQGSSSRLARRHRRRSPSPKPDADSAPEAEDEDDDDDDDDELYFEEPEFEEDEEPVVRA